jgi:hypothetical protein
MTRPPLSALLLARLLAAVGLAALAAITLAYPGATRMYAWPWTLAYATALLAPALALILRGLDRGQPLARPGGGGTALVLGAVAVVLGSALVSPFRGPSLLWSAPLLAAGAWFFLLCDWRGDDSGRRESLHRAAAAAGLVVGAVSVGLWFARLRAGVPWLEARNAFPLGHASYTAGLALVILPFALGVALRAAGGWRVMGGAAAGLAVVMLFTSGSRGGLLGLAALGVAGLVRVRWPARVKIALGAGAALVGLLVAVAHPRTRATLFGGSDAHLVAASEVQRAAMTTAGGRMGADRPLLGWGPGTTPLVYPNYRGGLRGGAENVLQLHSLPVHVWAEFGAGGFAVLLAAGVLAWRGRVRDGTAFAAAAGYGAFALTDWQLDVPVFAFAAAALAALLAPPGEDHSIGEESSRVGDQSAVGSAEAEAERRRGRTTGHAFTAFKRGYAASGGIAFVTLAALALVVLLGRPDPAPALNGRALELARDPAQAERAIGLLRESLALNPDQEIAHFNLGWLLLVREPAAAERHFLAAARLVPDKGGVYFGIGLARLNRGDRAGAAQALALECLHDPAFLASPWWREPAVAALREAAAAALVELVRRAAGAVAVPAGLRPGLLGRVPDGPERVYRRERTGYPVLMRNLDLPPPRDLYDVREPAALPPDVAALPGKGWLPGALPLTLLAPAEPPRS